MVKEKEERKEKLSVKWSVKFSVLTTEDRASLNS